jgi:uncharacterized membrane protein YjfL (UPF0719 family)
MVMVITVILLFAYFYFLFPKIMEIIGDDSFASGFFMFILAIGSIYLFLWVAIQIESM